jgi:tripartite-type tricarboxylate transporter receptor subunit TctC
MISRRSFALASGLLLAGHADSQVTHQSTWVVPYSAGSAQDTLARLLSQQHSHDVNAPLVVLNKPGAGGTIASAQVAKSKADGRTLLLAASSHDLAGALVHSLPYHPLNSFRAAAFMGFSEYVLVASADLQAARLDDFVKRIALAPQRYHFASSGQGSATHVGMAAFLARAGLEMTHVPFKGTGEVIQEILAGRIQAAILPTLSLHPFKTDARLRPLALTSLERSAHFPDLPTVGESGYPGFRWISWVGLLAPKGVPDAKIQSIHEAMQSVLADPAVQKRLQSVGIATTHWTPEQFDQLLKTDWSDALTMTRQLQLTAD